MVSSKECKFVVYSDPNAFDNKLDLHFVKEVTYFKDGKTSTELKVIEDYQRPFWITKPMFRKHKQKKESEYLNRLEKHYSSQKDLNINASKVLGYKNPIHIYRLRDNPYLYGISVDTRALIKKEYMLKYKDIIPNFNVATYDIEVDVDKNEIVIISIAMKDKIATFIKESVLNNINNPIDKLYAIFNKYVPNTDITKNIHRRCNIEYIICKDELDLVKSSINKAHEWQPDLLAVWNIKYDMGKLLEVLNKYNVDPKDIFSDPSVKQEHRFFNIKYGIEKKVTASGVVQPKSPEEQWHTFECPCYFYWIDAMSVYNYIRTNLKKVPGGYSLNNILEHELGSKYKKLKFSGEMVDGIDWHKYMLKNKPLEYIIYNQWDVLSMIELDMHTKDLHITLPTLSSCSSFNIFHKGPSRIVDDIHFLYLSLGKVLGCPPSNKSYYQELLGRDGWILTLPIDRIKDNENNMLVQKGIHAGIFLNIYDIDQSSGYPSNTIACNVSKDTTISELINIEGYEKEEFIKQNMNLLYGKINSLEYCNTMFNLPSLLELSKLIKL